MSQSKSVPGQDMAQCSTCSLLVHYDRGMDRDNAKHLTRRSHEQQPTNWSKVQGQASVFCVSGSAEQLRTVLRHTDPIETSISGHHYGAAAHRLAD